MRVAVTGATGNVGTSLVDMLVSDERVHEIVAIARREPEGWRPAKTSFVAADVATDDLSTAFRGVDAVVHLAWLFQPTHAPMVTWRANVEGSIRVFRAAAAAGATTLVHASSVGSYSPVDHDRLVDETWPTHSVPTAAYGREKAYVERVLDAFELDHPDIRVVRFRPAFIFKRVSATQQRRLFAGPLVPATLAGSRRIPVVPLPRNLRFQALHTEDVAAAYHLSIVGDARGSFNLASGPIIDTNTLARLAGGRPLLLPPRAVRGALGSPFTPIRLHSDPGEKASSRATEERALRYT